jgi:hypothetical protein
MSVVETTRAQEQLQLLEAVDADIEVSLATVACDQWTYTEDIAGTLLQFCTTAH